MAKPLPLPDVTGKPFAGIPLKTAFPLDRWQGEIR
jgi:hypothetical protein